MTTKRAKRGDLILNLLYQVYDSGKRGEEEGMGSFIEEVSIRILDLIDRGAFSAGTTYPASKYVKYTLVEHPTSGPSWSISMPDKDNL